MQGHYTQDNNHIVVKDLRMIAKADLIGFAMRVPDDLIPVIANQAILEAGVTHAIAADILQARLLGRLDTVPALVGAWQDAKLMAVKAMRLGYDNGLTVVTGCASARMLTYMQAHFKWAKHYRLAEAARDRALEIIG